MKNIFKKAFAFVIFLATLFFLSACGGKKAELVICVGPNPDTIDPALNSAVDGATVIIHAFSGLVGYQLVDGKLELVPDCVKKLPEPVTLTGGKVKYVFTMKDGLKWSDGSALTAADFEYAWKRAVDPATGADYEYMFDVIDGYEENNLNVKASADGKQLTVVLKNFVPYFFELCAFPTYMPVKKSVVEVNPDAWATKPKTYIGNGPYKMTYWKHNSKMIFEKNENYHNAEQVKIKSIEFALSDDDNAILTNYINGKYKFIDTVPNQEIARLKKDYPSEFVVTGQLGTYYICFNIADDVIYGDIVTDEVKKANVRKALSLLIDRNHIVEQIGQAGQIPANSYVPSGLTEPDGAEFVSKSGVNRDGQGYYSVKKTDYQQNCATAVQLLKDAGYTWNETSKKFTNFPSFNYITNPSTGHEAIATYIKEVFAGYGITMNISTQEWNTFLNTRKNGDYTIARNGWLGDYNDPITFLDMWISTSGNNDCQFGKGSHTSVAIYGANKDKTWAQTYDAIIGQVKTSTNPETRFNLMHQAEDLLMETGAICPVYFYTDLYMINPKLKGFFASPLGYKFFMYCELAT
ncbi:MAG: peptide ABC transporter substrate-binding protein [Bacilli bacterium]|nr:peptide ABC transporter substrate-binding protein [Bacilli bacterium]